MSLSQRQSEVDDFFRSSQFVCKFAPNADIAYEDVEPEQSASKQVIDLLSDEIRGDVERKVYCLVSQQNEIEGNYASGKSQSIAIATEVLLGMMKKSDERYDIDVCRDEVARHAEALINTENPYSLQNYFPSLYGEYFYTMALGPEYPEKHTRYAPNNCVVAMPQVLVERAQQSQCPHLRATQAHMRSRAGMHYDGAFLYLPEDINQMNEDMLTLSGQSKQIDLPGTAVAGLHIVNGKIEPFYGGGPIIKLFNLQKQV